MLREIITNILETDKTGMEIWKIIITDPKVILKVKKINPEINRN